MTRLSAAFALACALLTAFLVSPASAAPKPARATSSGLAYCAGDASYRNVCPGAAARLAARAGRAGRQSAGDPRPRAWCGWWLRQQLGVSDRSGNLARWWARYGANAHGPAVGAIVVWPHHVGLITARSEDGWVVKSGNDDHAVRERPRSLAGAIAFRWPNQWASR